MQAHIGVCNTNAGQEGIAACLDANGLLEAGLQTDIDTCVTAVGIGSVAKCLRNKGILPNQLLQAHVNSCDQAAGDAAIFNCLNANGLFPAATTVTQATINTCIANVGVAGIAKCLVNQKLVTDFPVQAHINGCNHYAGQEAITTCLNGSGLLLTGLTQAQIDQCVTAVGIAGVYGCLVNNGFIQTYSQLIGTGGVFNVNCMSCHNAGNLNGNMNILSYTSVLGKVVAGSPSTSKLYQKMTTAASPMPPSGLLPAADAALVFTWINQGAKNN
jgi:hypothetical protein